MRVLSVASEAVPLIKTGGLADVVGALPSVLAPLGTMALPIAPLSRPTSTSTVGLPRLSSTSRPCT